MGGLDVADGLDARVGMREGVDPVGAQLLELLAPDGEEVALRRGRA